MIFLCLYTRLFPQLNRGLNWLFNLLMQRYLYLLMNVLSNHFDGFEDVSLLVHAVQLGPSSSSMPFALEKWYGFNCIFMSLEVPQEIVYDVGFSR